MVVMGLVGNPGSRLRIAQLLFEEAAFFEGNGYNLGEGLGRLFASYGSCCAPIERLLWELASFRCRRLSLD